MIDPPVGEVVMKVVAARPPAVRPDARVRVLAAVQPLVDAVEPDETADVRGAIGERRDRERRADQDADEERRRDQLLPPGGKVVALDVVPHVLDAERAAPEPPIVTHPAMDQVLEQRPAQHAACGRDDHAAPPMRTSPPGRAPVSSPRSAIGTPATSVAM